MSADRMRLIRCLECGALTTRESRCLTCEASSQRGYGAAWRIVRAEHLRIEPHCRSCGAPATDVDHIVTKRNGGTDDQFNLRSLCHPCHSRRTLRDSVSRR